MSTIHTAFARYGIHRVGLRLFIVLGVVLGVTAARAQTTTSPGNADPTAKPPQIIVPTGIAAAFEVSSAQAAAEAQQRLSANPRDDEARYALGIAQTLQSLERSARTAQSFGLRRDLLNILGIVGIPVMGGSDDSDEPGRPTTYGDIRALIATTIDDLLKAEATFASIQDPSVKLTLRPGMIRVTLAPGDAAARHNAAELMGALFAGGRGINAEHFAITFDRADVEWFRGYLRLIAFMGEFVLAHDFEETFNHTAHMFLRKPVTPYPFLKFGGINEFRMDTITDAIVLLHLQRHTVVEPQRLARCLEHLEAVIARSRECRRLIEAETDDDREWIPSIRQHSVLTWLRFDQARVDAWDRFLSEMHDILAGKKLVMFWREGEPRGVNLRRALLEHREFDVWLWLQGTAAAPYLETGVVSSPDTWAQIQRVFQGEFMFYLMAVN